MEPVAIRAVGETDLSTISAQVLVSGLPGIGHVGKLVAEHLIRELSARKVAEIHSLAFPPQVIIGESGVIRLVNNEIHLADTHPHPILFLTGDYQSISSEGHYILADAILQFAHHAGVRRLYTLGGFGVGHLVEDPRILGAISRPSLRDETVAAGAVLERDAPGGAIVGAAGLLIGLGEYHGIEGVCLMGETSGYLVDPKSAARLLSVLTRMIGISVDSTLLAERGALMEQVIARMMEIEHPSGADDELRYIG